MKNISIRFFLFLITGLFFLSCKAQQTTKMMTFEDNIDTIRIQKEADFAIQLVSSYGNGYQWQIKTKLDHAIIQLDSTSIYRPADYEDQATLEESKKVWEQFFFKGIEKGEMRLEFQQVRIWQPESVQDSASFEVIVE